VSDKIPTYLERVQMHANGPFGTQAYGTVIRRVELPDGTVLVEVLIDNMPSTIWIDSAFADTFDYEVTCMIEVDDHRTPEEAAIGYVENIADFLTGHWSSPLRLSVRPRGVAGVATQAPQTPSSLQYEVDVFYDAEVTGKLLGEVREIYRNGKKDDAQLKRLRELYAEANPEGAP
jgi:hypothetical protein